MPTPTTTPTVRDPTTLPRGQSYVIGAECQQPQALHLHVRRTSVGLVLHFVDTRRTMRNHEFNPIHSANEFRASNGIVLSSDGQPEIVSTRGSWTRVYVPGAAAEFDETDFTTTTLDLQVMRLHEAIDEYNAMLVNHFGLLGIVGVNTNPRSDFVELDHPAVTVSVPEPATTGTRRGMATAPTVGRAASRASGLDCPACGPDVTCGYTTTFRCAYCTDLFHDSGSAIATRGGLACAGCGEESGATCSHCGERDNTDHGVFVEDGETFYCRSCHTDRAATCRDCDGNFRRDHMREREGRLYCRNCDPQGQPSPRGAYPRESMVLTEDKGEMETLHTIGIEFECTKLPLATGAPPRPVVKFDHPWNVNTDSSISPPGLEFVTPPMNGVKVREVVSKGLVNIKAGGYGVNHSCGTHVHVGGIAEKDLWKLVNAWVSIEDVIYAMLPEGRRTGGYSKPMGGVKITNLLKDGGNVAHWFYGTTDQGRIQQMVCDKWHDSRYFGMNLHSYWYRGTIEFRMFPGTVDEDKIILWSRFLLSIIKWASESYDPAVVMKNLKDERDAAVRAAEAFKDFKMADDVAAWAVERVAKMNGGKALKEWASPKEVVV